MTLALARGRTQCYPGTREITLRQEADRADVEFHVAMTPEDLARAGLDALGKKWSATEPEGEEQ